MFTFDPAGYGNATGRLLADVSLCELGPGRPQEDRYEALSKLTVADLVPEARDVDMARCCLAALWLRHNYLDRSHEISQEIGASSGSYWHGIMHRREPDYSNSKYWYRRVGEHPIFPALREAALAILHNAPGSTNAVRLEGPSWDPYAFVDFCESASQGHADDQLLARQIATTEWQLLFDHCYQRAR